MTSPEADNQTPQRVEIQENPVVFDGGAFTIDHLSTSPRGLQVQTKLNLRRRQGVFSRTDTLPISKEQRERIKKSMQFDVRNAERKSFGEMKAEPEDPQISAFRREQFRKEGLTDEEIEKKERELESFKAKRLRRNRFENMRSREHTLYVGSMVNTQKVGIRNVERNGDTLLVDTVGIPYALYDVLGRPTEKPETLLLSSVTGTALILETADGKLLLQHRSPKNKIYGDIPGASAAGLFDANYNRGNPPGTVSSISGREVRRNVIKEAKEEVGVEGRSGSITTGDVKGFAVEKLRSEIGEEEGDLTELTLVGVAKDRVKIHDEFLLSAKSNRTASEIIEIARTAPKQSQKDTVDFEESFVFIDATPEAIETLLTQVKSPLPPTHAAAFLAKGYLMVLEGEGLEKANEWMRDMEVKTRRNWQEIDRIVKIYHENHPQAQELHSGINTDAYDPNYLPTIQGLPPLEDELERTQLEAKVEKTVNTAYLFDVDGVITDINEKKVTQEEMFDQLIIRLDNGTPIAFNTGRAASWVVGRVVEPLKKRLKEQGKNPGILSNLFVVSEKGGVTIEFDRDGNMTEHIDQSLSVPANLEEDVKRMIQERYSYAIEVDPDKQTMLSTEKKMGFPQDEFEEIQPTLTKELETLVALYGLSDKLRVDPTTIATDIENVQVGKDLGARKFLAWLQDKNLSPRKFVAFGDSESDSAMAYELKKQGSDVKFVFVGEKLAKKDRDYEVVEARETFSKVTLRYLKEEDATT